AFRGGVSVAAGDVDGDRVAEVVTGPGAGSGPHVRVFKAYGAEFRNVFPYDTRFTGGVSVAVADVSNDRRGQIITGAGPGGGPHVKAILANDSVALSFYAFDPAFTGGAFVG